MPPMLEWRRFLARRDRPYRERLLASLVQARLWGAEMFEALRLLFGGVPERH